MPMNFQASPPRAGSRRSWSVVMVVVLLLFGSVGCKSKKKVAETNVPDQTAAAEAAQLAKVQGQLQAMLDTRYRDLDQLAGDERSLAQIKAMGVTDPTTQALIQQVEDHFDAERQRLRALQKAMEAKNQMADMKNSLEQTFSSIATANSLNMANTRIDRALGMFNSPDAPVLIIIARENGNPDYDEPTTIKKYLNYLKDQQRNPNRVENIYLDANGNIKELELIKATLK